jgi:hypothetical protein
MISTGWSSYIQEGNKKFFRVITSGGMFKVYANFTDQEINDRIYEKYGLKNEDKRHVTLKKCPRCSNVLRLEDKFCSQCSLVTLRG